MNPHSAQCYNENGWALFPWGDSDERLTVRHHFGPKFSSDEAAQQHVIEQAKLGDETCIEALRLIAMDRLKGNQ